MKILKLAILSLAMTCVSAQAFDHRYQREERYDPRVSRWNNPGGEGYYLRQQINVPRWWVNIEVPISAPQYYAPPPPVVYAPPPPVVRYSDAPISYAPTYPVIPSESISSGSRVVYIDKPLVLPAHKPKSTKHGEICR